VTCLHAENLGMDHICITRSSYQSALRLIGWFMITRPSYQLALRLIGWCFTMWPAYTLKMF